MSDQKNSSAVFPGQRRSCALWVLLLALALRMAAAWGWREELRIDRDGYLALAQNLAAGKGYSVDGRRPTAFRPPLYPLFLAAAIQAGQETLAAAQILLGTATVLLTYFLGRELLSRSLGFWAALLVAVDPLLLRYTPQIMTETLFTFLVTLLMLLVVRFTGTNGAATVSQRTSAKRELAYATGIGVLFGCCALCRPTIWALGALFALAWIARLVCGADRVRQRLAVGGAAFLALSLTVSPWVIRNVRVFDRPIVMTTHGGYTLLLGNNPVFYGEVVRQPWGTVWDGKSLMRWQRSLEEEMRNDNPIPQTEFQRDRWMFRRALRCIGDDPGGFAAACWLRLRRFWNVVPQGEAAEQMSPVIRWSVGIFYTLLAGGAIIGLLRGRDAHKGSWRPLLLLLVSITAVHVVYWSNARMRAPLIPVVALLAVRGVFGGGKQPPAIDKSAQKSDK